jgi:hypothetical protein
MTLGADATEIEEIDMIKGLTIALGIVTFGGMSSFKGALLGGLIDPRTFAAFLVVWSTAVVTLGPFYGLLAFSEKEAMPETDVNFAWLGSCCLPLVGISFLILFADLLLEFGIAALCTHLIALLVGLVGTAASRWPK